MGEEDYYGKCCRNTRECHRSLETLLGESKVTLVRKWHWSALGHSQSHNHQYKYITFWNHTKRTFLGLMTRADATDIFIRQVSSWWEKETLQYMAGDLNLLLKLPLSTYVIFSNSIRLSRPHSTTLSIHSNNGIHVIDYPIYWDIVRWRKSASQTKCCLNWGLSFEWLLTWWREALEGEPSSREELHPSIGLNLEMKRSVSESYRSWMGSSFL